MRSFTKEPLHLNDVVVYLRNERTGSSTVRKCKYVGQIVDFTKQMVKVMRLSPPDTFVSPEECRQLEIDRVYPEDIVNIIVGEDDRSITKTLEQVNNLVDNYKAELEFTRKFIHDHGLEFALASAWDRHKSE